MQDWSARVTAIAQHCNKLAEPLAENPYPEDPELLQGWLNELERLGDKIHDLFNEIAEAQQVLLETAPSPPDLTLVEEK